MGKKRTKGKNQRRALRDRLMRQALDKEKNQREPEVKPQDPSQMGCPSGNEQS